MTSFELKIKKKTLGIFEILNVKSIFDVYLTNVL